MIKKAIWISYDLGIKGDYDGLYTWLDNNQAKECGENLAIVKYKTNKTCDIPELIKSVLEESVSFGKRDRIYIMWKDGHKIKGKFIVGRRKSSPWEGYGYTDTDTEEDF